MAFKAWQTALVGGVFLVGALCSCSDGDSSGVDPVLEESSSSMEDNPYISSSEMELPGSSSQFYTPASSETQPVGSSSSMRRSSSSVALPTNLPSNSSDPKKTVEWFNAWKEFHVATLYDEKAKYPSLGKDFTEIFGEYISKNLPVARVIWSTYSWDGCLIEEANGSNMYKRGCTVSEGIGYGMLIAVFQEDWDTYDGLWNYSKAYRHTAYAGGNGLMPWLTSTFSWDIGDKASATDADLDIATSLIVAYKKTKKQEYLTDAIELAGNIWEHEINPANNLIYSGDTPMWKKDDAAYNPSYFSPVALRLFAEVDRNHAWNDVLDAEYAYMQKMQESGTGVFPDWSNAAGQAIDPKNNSADKTYWTFNKESVRIPWRIAWDYYWSKDERAASILNTLQKFIAEKSSNDPTKIPAVNYSFDLSVGADISGQTLSTQWLGAWCLTGMAGATEWLNACTAVFNQQKFQTSASSYFTNILQTMFSQLLNGWTALPE